MLHKRLTLQALVHPHMMMFALHKHGVRMCPEHSNAKPSHCVVRHHFQLPCLHPAVFPPMDGKLTL